MKLSTAQKKLARYLRQHRRIGHAELKWMFRPSTATVWLSGIPGPMLRLVKKGLAKADGDGFKATDTLIMSEIPPKGRVTALHHNWIWEDPLD